MIRLAAILVCLAGPAPATQEYILPTLFDVIDVAADDVLNIRAEPSARAEIFGALAPDAERIEVVAHDASGRWGQVNTGERAGWVAMRYLAYRTDVWEPGRLPAGLRCLGTEPFWSLSLGNGQATFAAPAEPETTARIAAVLDTGVFRDPRRAVLAEGDGFRMTAALTTEACSDGMSDLAYGLTTMVVVEDAAGPALLAGCCRIAP
ncbi:hypothetical protein BH23PSE1_BH23PSE1_03970 [soil metagenome]